MALFVLLWIQKKKVEAENCFFSYWTISTNTTTTNTTTINTTTTTTTNTATSYSTINTNYYN